MTAPTLTAACPGTNCIVYSHACGDSPLHCPGCAEKAAVEAERDALRTERDALARGAVTCWREVEHLQARLARVTALVETWERVGAMPPDDDYAMAIRGCAKRLRAELEKS